jgi:hypothetical protein
MVHVPRQGLALRHFAAVPEFARVPGQLATLGRVIPARRAPAPTFLGRMLWASEI